MTNLINEFPHLNPKYLKELEGYASDILGFEDYLKHKKYLQHGTVSVYEHCISVACKSLEWADKNKHSLDRRQLTRAALLHDYFKYDWHTYAKENKMHKLHGLHHPRIAAEYAENDFKTTKLEDNAIRAHMWPLGSAFPKSLEAWIIFFADKNCAFKEALTMRKKKIRRLSSSGRAIHS